MTYRLKMQSPMTVEVHRPNHGIYTYTSDEQQNNLDFMLRKPKIISMSTKKAISNMLCEGVQHQENQQQNANYTYNKLKNQFQNQSQFYGGYFENVDRTAALYQVTQKLYEGQSSPQKTQPRQQINENSYFDKQQSIHKDIQEQINQIQTKLTTHNINTELTNQHKQQTHSIIDALENELNKLKNHFNVQSSDQIIQIHQNTKNQLQLYQHEAKQITNELKQLKQQLIESKKDFNENYNNLINELYDIVG